MGIQENCVYLAMAKLLPDKVDRIYELCDRYKRDPECIRINDGLIGLSLQDEFPVKIFNEPEKIKSGIILNGYLKNKLISGSPLLVSVNSFSDNEFENLGHSEAFLPSDLETDEGNGRVGLIESYLFKYGGVIFYPKLY